MWPIPVIILLIAVISQLISKFVSTSKDTLISYSDAKSLFVVCISFRSSSCFDFVYDILRKAKNPQRLHIAVIEFIGHPEETMLYSIPHQFKNKISIQSLAISSATTLASARKLAFNEFYRNEDICLFLNEINIVEHWDSIITSNFSKEYVLSIMIGKKDASVFPSIPNVYGTAVSVKAKKFQTNVNVPFGTLLCTEDVIACDEKHVDTLLKYDSIEMRNANISQMKIPVFTTTTFLGSKAVVLNKIPATVTEDDKATINQWINTFDPIKARLGLTKLLQTPEAIAKFGTVQACRLALAIAKNRKSRKH